MSDATLLNHVLRAVHGDHTRLETWSAHPLTDRAHNRVVRYELRATYGATLRCVGKSYEVEADALRVADIIRAVNAGGKVATPRLLAVDVPRCLLVFTYEEGDPFTPALAGEERAVTAAVGRALAALHATPVPAIVERVTTAALVLDDLRPRVAELRGRLPRLSGSLPRRLAELERDLPSDPPVLSLVHGDFGPANLVWNGREVVVLDFDRCARGDPALDLGTLFTQLHRSALRAPARLPRLSELRARVLEAYGADADLDARVRWYERAVLVRKIHSLALDTTRHARPDRIRQRHSEAVRLLEMEESHAPSV
jgi:aminoglycoside phosphotransferase (APT) family kinase protein